MSCHHRSVSCTRAQKRRVRSGRGLGRTLEHVILTTFLVDELNAVNPDRSVTLSDDGDVCGGGQSGSERDGSDEEEDEGEEEDDDDADTD